MSLSPFKISFIAIAVLLLPQHTFASQERNPYLKPSERAENVDSVCRAETDRAEVERLQKLLERELSSSNRPEMNKNVLGRWTKQDIERSRFIGHINNHMVYFHNDQGVFFSLDLDQAK